MKKLTGRIVGFVCGLLVGTLIFFACLPLFYLPKWMNDGDHSIIISNGGGIKTTNSYEFAFGGNGQPVKRVTMTHAEWEVLHGLLLRAK